MAQTSLFFSDSKIYHQGINRPQVVLYFYLPKNINMSTSDKFKIGLSEENSEMEPLTQGVHVDEDADLHPNELSGDQNGQQSILASTAEGVKANLLFTVTTIVKTVIGSGILTIPYTMGRMGYILGIALFLGGACLIQFASVLLLKAKNLSHHSNYATIFYAIWPSRIAKGIGSLIIFLTNLGVCIAELIIFKESIRKIFEDVIENKQVLDSFYTKPIFIVLVIALLEMPLTLASKIEKLKIMGLLGVVGIVLYMFTFIIYYILCSVDESIGKAPVGDMRMFPDDWYGAAAAVPNIFFAITFQNNFFPVFKGMSKASDKKMVFAAFIGVIFCAASYILVGILGYSYVGEAVQANFLSSFVYTEMSKPFFYLLNQTFLLSIFFAFPIMFFGCRNNFIALIKLVMLKKQIKRSVGWRAGGDTVEEISTYIRDQEYETRKKKARMHFIGYTLLIYLIMVGVALGVNDIEIVFNAIGGLCTSSIGFLMPCYFYVRLVMQKKKPRTVKWYVSIVIFVVMAPYSVFSVVSLYIPRD